jgi:hypothetical protein
VNPLRIELTMSKGYAEGPAAEAAEARRDALERGDATRERRSERSAVYGSTADDPERHFLGWLDDTDPDELFASGEAWGISVVRRAAEGVD